LANVTYNWRDLVTDTHKNANTAGIVMHPPAMKNVPGNVFMVAA